MKNTINNLIENTQKQQKIIDEKNEEIQEMTQLQQHTEPERLTTTTQKKRNIHCRLQQKTHTTSQTHRLENTTRHLHNRPLRRTTQTQQTDRRGNKDRRRNTYYARNKPPQTSPEGNRNTKIEDTTTKIQTHSKAKIHIIQIPSLVKS